MADEAAQDEIETTDTGATRRDVIKKAAVVGGAVWAAPAISTLMAGPANAASVVDCAASCVSQSQFTVGTQVNSGVVGKTNDAYPVVDATFATRCSSYCSPTPMSPLWQTTGTTSNAALITSGPLAPTISTAHVRVTTNCQLSSSITVRRQLLGQCNPTAGQGPPVDVDCTQQSTFSTNGTGIGVNDCTNNTGSMSVSTYSSTTGTCCP